MLLLNYIRNRVMKYDTANEMFKLAVELVCQSSRNIFLTGKAGTGKTTFLKKIARKNWQSLPQPASQL